MPLPKGKSKRAQDERFHEFRHGKTYAKTAKKHGEKVANRQLVAVALKGKKKAKKKGKK